MVCLNSMSRRENVLAYYNEDVNYTEGFITWG